MKNGLTFGCLTALAVLSYLPQFSSIELEEMAEKTLNRRTTGWSTQLGQHFPRGYQRMLNTSRKKNTTEATEILQSSQMEKFSVLW